MRRLLLPAVFVSLLLLAACAPKTVVTPAKQASTYFQEGESLFEKGLYEDAIASWEKVRDSYYSPELNILAELKIAEALFLNEQYIEASAAYEAFLKNHPEHARIPDVLFQLGLCNIYQMADKDQDQSATRQALAVFETLLKRYPQDRRREEIQSYIDRCLNQLAANEVVVAEFYMKVRQYPAAINRLEGVLKKYPTYYDRAEAYYLLGQAYLLSGDTVKSNEAFNVLISQFPYSEYIPASQKFIEKN
jgi:outer membrane protein assembly factor BamD